MKSTNINVAYNLPLNRISNLLSCAFESGGIAYWAEIVNYRKPIKLEFRSYRGEEYPHLDYPLNKGGRIIIRDIEADKPTKHMIDLGKIRKGLKLMAVQEPKHFADLLSENEDMMTGDVFIQLTVFGKVIYG